MEEAPRSSANLRAVWSADLVAWDPKTDSVRTVVALGDVLGDPKPHFDLAGSGLPFPLWYRLWAVCGDGIDVFDRLGNQVRRFTRDGREIEAVALPPAPPAEVSRDAYARTLFFFAVVEAEGAVVPNAESRLSAADSARIMNRFMARVTAPPEQLGNLLPRYTDLRCDDEGTLWMRPFDIDEGGIDGSPVWLRIAADGRTSRVRLPERFDPYRFTHGRIWGIQRDSLDVASVAWIGEP